MTKLLNERVAGDDEGLVIRKTFDATDTLDWARKARDAGRQDFGESKLIGRVPGPLVDVWLKEAGVQWGTPEAAEVLKRKMLDGEFSKFRVWEGTF